MTISVAPLWRRTLAALIDLAPVLALTALVAWALVASDPSPPEIPPWNPLDRVVDYIQLRPGRSALVVLTFVALHIGWAFVWAALSPHGASLGQRALGVSPIDVRGLRPSNGRLLGWLALRVPSTLLAGLGLWWALVDVERRTLHDRAASVWVTRPTPRA